MLLILLIAWAQFIPNIGQRGVWLDEAYSWYVSNSSAFEIPGILAEIDVHPPVYYTLLAAWRAFTGSEDAGIMRLSSSLIALLTIALCYTTVTDWFGRRWAGFTAASVLAVSGVFIYFASELRMYALTAFLVVLSWWLLLRLVRGQQGWIAYGAVIALLVYTYYFSAFIIVMQALAILFLFRSSLRRFMLALVVAVVAVLPWLPIIAQQIAQEREGLGITTGPLIGKFAATTATSVENINIFVNLYTNRQVGLVLIVIIAAIAGLWHPSVRRNRRWRNATIVALLWSFGTAVFFFGVNLVIPVYNPRYPLFALPGLAMLTGAAVVWLPGKLWRSVAVALILLVGIQSAGLFPLEVSHGQILESIASDARPSDRILYAPDGTAWSPQGINPLRYYVDSGTVMLAASSFIQSESELASVDRAARIWDVRSGDPSEPYSDMLLNGRWLTKSDTNGGYTTRLFEPLPESGASWLDDAIEMRAELSGRLVGSGASTAISTWWRASIPPTADYSYTVQLLDASGQTVFQTDAGLNADGKPTSQWGNDWLFASLPLTVPENLQPGDYSLWLGVYDWRDPVRLPVQGGGLSTDTEQNLVQIGHLRIGS